MKIIKFIDNHLEKTFMFLLTLVMVFAIITQIIMRKVFNNSLSWSEELATYSLVWLVFIGISYAVKEKRHIKIDIVYAKLTKKRQYILDILVYIVFLAFSIYVFVKGIDIALAKFSVNSRSPSLNIPTGVLTLAVPMGLGLTIIRLVQNLITDLKLLKTTKK